MRQWIVHPDGTWIWSVEKPEGKPPVGQLQAVQLPDANTHPYVTAQVYITESDTLVAGDVSFLGAISNRIRGRFITYYKRRMSYNGSLEWRCDPSPRPQPAPCDELRTATRELVDKLIKGDCYLSYDVYLAITKAQEALARG